MRVDFANTAAKLAGCLLLAVTIPCVASAQAFVTPVETVPFSKGSYVILNDGTRYEGKIKMAMLMNGYMKSLSFLPDGGEKIKVKAADVKQLGAKVNKLVKMEMISDALGNKPSNPFLTYKAFAGVDWKHTLQREYIVFEQAVLPGDKKEKYRLLQLLNPGFDKLIKVYQHVKSSSFIGQSKGVTTYMIVKDEGERAILVKKKSYKTQFGEMFGDCKAFMDAYAQFTPRFEDMAAHIFAYDLVCVEDQEE